MLQCMKSCHRIDDISTMAGGDISLNQMFSTPMSLVVPGSVPSHYVEYVSTGSQGYWDEYAGADT